MMTVAFIPDFLIVAAIAIFGAILGSFSTALSFRVPRGIPGVLDVADTRHRRSRCPSCDHVLGARDLLPLLSWVSTRGRCRYCGAGIGVLYPLSELVCLSACLAIYAVYGLSWTALCFMLMTPFLVALIAIDIRHGILPDVLVICCAVLAVAAALPELVNGRAMEFGLRFLSAALYAGLCLALAWFTGWILKKEAMGFGDVKFLAVAGFILGLPLIGIYLVLSGGIGVVFGLLWNILRKEDVFPFGPALIVALFLLILT